MGSDGSFCSSFNASSIDSLPPPAERMGSNEYLSSLLTITLDFTASPSCFYSWLRNGESVCDVESKGKTGQ